MHDLKINKLSYKYPLTNDWTLKNITLEALSGEITAIIGNNGSGKTTLCNSIRRFIPDFYKGKFTGNITIQERDINNYSVEELSRKFGYVSQNPFSQITGATETVFGEIAFGIENLGIPLPEVKEIVKNIVEEFKLEEILDKNPLELSGGQKQKVALAAVIAMDPDIFIIDEPTSQLDPVATKEIFKMINNLKKRNKIIILVEHKMDLLSEYADKIYVLNKGEVLLHGTPKKVFNNLIDNSYQIDIPVSLKILKELKKYQLLDQNQSFPTTRGETLQYLKKMVIL